MYVLMQFYREQPFLSKYFGEELIILALRYIMKYHRIEVQDMQKGSFLSILREVNQYSELYSTRDTSKNKDQTFQR